MSMKLFLSWSGERSKAVASALREWISLILHSVEPWQSNDDILAGSRWASEVATELETTNFGILCVTQENLNAPWILFEAGALAKSISDASVVPLLLDVEFQDISGPLSAFQAKKLDKVGLHEVVIAMNAALSEPVAETRVEKLFNSLWPELEESLKRIPQAQAPKKPARATDDVLEELVGTVRSMDNRLRHTEDPDNVEWSPRGQDKLSLVKLERAVMGRPQTLGGFFYAVSIIRGMIPPLDAPLGAVLTALVNGNDKELARGVSMTKLLMDDPAMHRLVMDSRWDREVMSMASHFINNLDTYAIALMHDVRRPDNSLRSLDQTAPDADGERTRQRKAARTALSD